MYPIILQIHSILRYAILLFLIVLVVRNLIAWLTGLKFSKPDNILSSVTVSTAHLQLIAGILLYITSPLVSFGNGMIHDEVMRYYTLEHILLMLVAIALLTIGRAKLRRKADSVAKHRTSFIYSISGLLIIVLALAMSGRGIL